jgi:hypothetical protein
MIKQAQKDESKPQRPVEPLRQFGFGPTLLVSYTFGLVMLQMILVGLGSKTLLQGC